MMKWFLVFLALMLLAPPASAWPVRGGSGGGGANPNCPNGTAFADGCQSANSTGTKISLPSEPFPPPWNRAGVDYPVGPPTPPLNDPTTFAWSAPFAYNATQKSVRCTDTATPAHPNPVIDGFDFTLHGGVFVADLSCTGMIVKNSKFRGGGCSGSINNMVQVFQENGSPQPVSVTLLYNEFDGGGVTYPGSCSIPGEMVQLQGGAGNQVVEYNYFHDFPQHALTSGASVSGQTGQLTEQYNLFTRCGFAQGFHCNGLNLSGGQMTGNVVGFNTYYSPQPDTAYSAGNYALPTATFTNGSPNIAIVSGPWGGGTASSLQKNMSIVPQAPCSTTPILLQDGKAGTIPTSLTLQANYSGTTNTCAFDISNAYPFGLVIPINYTLAGSSTDFLHNNTVQNNTIIQSGDGGATLVNTGSFSIQCGHGAGAANNSVQNTTVSQNYLDNSGNSGGAFYNGASHCTASDPTDFGTVTYTGNIDMQTNATLPAP